MNKQAVQLWSFILESPGVVNTEIIRNILIGKNRGPDPVHSDAYFICDADLTSTLTAESLGFDVETSNSFVADKQLDTKFEVNAPMGPMFFPSENTVYIGQMNKDKREGKGLLVKLAKPRFLYEGYFQADLPCVRGKILFDNGDSYVGGFSKGMMHGRGVYHTNFGMTKYSGEFKNDLPHGEGKEEWKDGSIYKGEFANGKKHGFGILESNQHIFEGDFKDGHFCGQGKFRLPEDRATYNGNWQNSVLVSKADIEYHDGRSYFGEVNTNLVPHGKGIFDSSRLKCEGVFELGLANGKMEILDHKKGDQKVGFFKGGNLERWSTAEEIEDDMMANPSLPMIDLNNNSASSPDRLVSKKESPVKEKPKRSKICFC